MSSDTVEPDACIVQLNYKTAMIDINSQLGGRDVESLKFLCSDFIPISKTEQFSTGLDIIMALQQMCLISEPDNVSFLAELLWLIGRVDLLRKLNTSMDIVKYSLAHSQLVHVSAYRVMLYKVCQEVTRENVSDFLFLCQNRISRSKREQIRDPHHLIYALEQLNIVGQQNLHFFSSVLSEIRRQDLAQKVKEHCQSCGIQSLEGDSFTEQNVVSRGRQVHGSTSVATNLVEDAWPGSSNLAVSYTPAVARLEPDDAEPLVRCRQLTLEGLTEDSQILHEELIPRSMPASIGHYLPRYTMNKEPRGICLIVNNEKFYSKPDDSRSKKMGDRPGSQVDCDRLKEVFTKFYFTVRVENNLEHDKLVQHMKKISQEDHTEYNCFICCILSHGVSGAVYGTDGITVPIRDLAVHFKPASCPSLHGKPKVFFIQACQGNGQQTGSSASSSDIEEDGPEVATVADEADFLYAMATVPGYVSYRSKQSGSWFITILVRKLEKLAKTCDLLSILTEVNRVVSLAATHEGNLKQVPAPMSTLTKKLYFLSS